MCAPCRWMRDVIYWEQISLLPPPRNLIKQPLTLETTDALFPAVIFCLKKSVACALWSWMWSDLAIMNTQHLYVAPWMRPARELTHRDKLVMKEVSKSREEQKRVMGREYSHSTLCTSNETGKPKNFKRKMWQEKRAWLWRLVAQTLVAVPTLGSSLPWPCQTLARLLSPALSQSWQFKKIHQSPTPPPGHMTSPSLVRSHSQSLLTWPLLVQIGQAWISTHWRLWPAASSCVV